MALTVNQKKRRVNTLLRRARRQGMTIADLATHIGVSHTTVWRWASPKGPHYSPANTRIDDVLARLEEIVK